MSAQVLIETRTPGGLLGEPERLVLEFPLQETLTVQELIRLKVEEEARRLAGLRVLEQPAVPPLPAALDLESQVRQAQQAFVTNQFLILVDGQRYTQLDQSITLGPQTTVKFIRLMPLTGG
jgi:hypothetical protein